MRLPRALFYLNLLLVLLSITAHEIAANDFIFLILTLFIAGLVWRFEAIGRPLSLDNRKATLLTGAAFLWMSWRVFTPALAEGTFRMLDLRASVVGQFLILVQCVNLLRKKGRREYFWMYMITVVHMGTAGLLLPSMGYGLLLLLYALTALCTLTVYHVWCEANDTDLERPDEVIVSRKLAFAAVPVTLLLTLPLAGIFAALPRREGELPLAPQFAQLASQPVAGFSETVRMGDVGRIQDNPTRVMRLTVSDPATNEPMRVEDLLLRGIALERYRQEGDFWVWRTDMTTSDENWMYLGRGDRTQSTSPIYRLIFPQYYSDQPYSELRCDITIEPLRRNLLFAPFAAESILLNDTSRVFGHPLLNMLSAGQRWRTPLDYTVISRIYPLPPNGPPQMTSDAPPQEYLNIFLDVPEGVSPRVRELAERIAPQQEFPNPADRAARILAFLSDTNRFAYTLDRQPTPGIEPVESFLFTNPTGHCEYFASAMTLLLRCSGIPARMVNGFKVFEYNPVGGHYVVRQSNAHSWAEAYVHPYGWRTYDPSVARDAVMPAPGLARRWYRNLYDAAEAFWARRVVNFDSEDQAAIYDRLHAAAHWMRRLWVRLIMQIAAETAGLNRRQLRQLGRVVEGPVRVAVTVAFVIVAAAAAFMLLVTLRKWFKGPKFIRSKLRFYARMERILARRGLRRPPGSTPWEFHAALAAQGRPEAQPAARIIEAFCLVRYGGKKLTERDRKSIENDLRDLAKSKHKGK